MFHFQMDVRYVVYVYVCVVVSCDQHGSGSLLNLQFFFPVACEVAALIDCL
jgi:hypothetical protein